VAEGLLRGGEFEILQADLVLSTGNVIGLKKSIINLTIFEDIFRFALTGSVMIQDAMNLASLGPIIGQEYFKLKIRTPTILGDERIIDYSENAFFITSLDHRVPTSGGTQMSVLSFCSREFVVNQRLRLKRTLTGSYSGIVEQMLRNDLNSKKKFYNEPSAESKKIISPNTDPYGIISMAMARAVSLKHGDPTYLFFENTRGFNFRTLGHLYASKPKLTYSQTLAGTKTDGRGSIDVLKNIQNIESYVISSAPDTLYNYTTGIYSSDMIVHDIVSKSYQTHTYNYLQNFDKERHIDNTVGGKKIYPLVNSLAHTPSGKNISSYPSKQYLQPTTSFDTDNSIQDDYYNMPYTPHNPQRSRQKRASQLSMLETALQVEVKVLGNTILGAGDIVECNIPYKATYKTLKNEEFDNLYKGKFLIKALRHDFNQASSQHTISMNLCKDNLLEPLTAPTDNHEPQSDKSKGTIYENWDNIGS